MPRPTRPPLTPEDLLRLCFASEPHLSPDGRWIVFVEMSSRAAPDRAAHGLRLVDVERGTVRQSTGGEHSDTSPSWTPDSRAVVFASDRGGRDGLWRIGVRDPMPERLLSLDGRLRAPRVSPDGRHVAFLFTPRSPLQPAPGQKPQPPAAQVRHVTHLGYKHDGPGFHDESWTHLWVLDLATRRARQLTSGPFDDGQHDWSPDGRRLAFVSNRIPRADLHATNSDVFVVWARGGRLRRLTHERGPKHSPSWSPDGRQIAFTGHRRWPDVVENLHVWVVPVGKGAPRDLMPDADLMCGNLLWTDTREPDAGASPRPLWSADGRRLFFLASQRGETNIWEVAADGGEPRQRTRGRHEIAAMSRSADGRRWAFVRSSATSPGDVYLATAGAVAPRRRDRDAARAAGDGPLLPGARVRRVTWLNDALLARRRLLAPEEMLLPCAGGHTVHGWVLRAAGRRTRRPAVLMVHGGPYAMYGWSFFHELQMLAGHGYHVFYTNLRGSVGYGRAFMRSLVGKWGLVDYDDLMRVTDAIEALPFVDRGRIALAGGAYGGYLTNWAIAHTRRYRCAISMRGVSNLISLYGTSDSGWDLVNEFEEQPPWQNLERWWRVSPLAYVENVRTPLLILHSEADHRCPVSQAEELFTALQVMGRDVEMVRFLDEGHELSRSGRPLDRVERLRRILDWYARKLRPGAGAARSWRRARSGAGAVSPAARNAAR